MESAINHEYINTYAEAYANRINDRFFSDHDLINGDDILSITEVRQVNLFVIKIVMVKWQSEAQKIRSPFFDYMHPDVQNALQDFLNVLSRHISMERKTFQPLLKTAVADVLLLIFSPYNYFSKELLNIGTPVTMAELQKRKKFVKINSDLYEAYLQKIEAMGAGDMQIKEAKQYFDQVCEEINFSPEDTEEYVSVFSRDLSFDVKKVYSEVQAQSNLSKNDENLPGDTPREEKVPIHEKFFEKKPTLVDELKKEPKSTVLDYHQKQKIESIKKNISIQQRFRFVRELFSEKDEFFTDTIDFLDNCRSAEDATNYLQEEFLSSGKWNEQDEVVTEFLTVVRKKFPD